MKHHDRDTHPYHHVNVPRSNTNRAHPENFSDRPSSFLVIVESARAYRKFHGQTQKNHNQIILTGGCFWRLFYILLTFRMLKMLWNLFIPLQLNGLALTEIEMEILLCLWLVYLSTSLVFKSCVECAPILYFKRIHTSRALCLSVYHQIRSLLLGFI